MTLLFLKRYDIMICVIWSNSLIIIKSKYKALRKISDSVDGLYTLPNAIHSTRVLLRFLQSHLEELHTGIDHTHSYYALNVSHKSDR